MFLISKDLKNVLCGVKIEEEEFLLVVPAEDKATADGMIDNAAKQSQAFSWWLLEVYKDIIKDTVKCEKWGGCAYDAAVKFQSGGKHIDSPVRSGNSGISSVPSGAELTEQATGISYGESRKSLQQETGYRCESAGISGKRHGKFRSNRGGKRQDCHF